MFLKIDLTLVILLIDNFCDVITIEIKDFSPVNFVPYQRGTRLLLHCTATILTLAQSYPDNF